MKSFPADKERVWSLLQSYSHIPPNEVESHLRDIREKGWKVFPYGCISHWIFLDCVITSSPEYSNILECLKSGGILLDAGCAFGYVLRQLAVDGAPAANLIGTDLQQGFLDLGYDLFKDRDTFKGRFLAGDLLNPDDHSLDEINDKVDIIHAAALFHLFDWEDQVVLGTRLVRLFKDGASQAMIVGRQIGALCPPDRATYKQGDGPGWYRHNLETWQDLWDEIGDNTGTKWKVSGTPREMEPSSPWSSGRAGLNFVIKRV